MNKKIVSGLLVLLFAFSAALPTAEKIGDLTPFHAYAEEADESEHVHSYTSEITTDPTCTASGVETFTCSCGDSYTQEIAATGHSYVATVVEPTYASQGYTLYECENCSYSYKSNYTAKKTLGKVTASSDFSSTSSAIRINWSAVDDADGYEVYRYNSSSSSWSKISTVTNALTYKNSSLSSATTYKYKIRAYVNYNGTNYYGDYSSVITAVTDPDKVSVLTSFTSTDSAVRINWNEVSSATGYRIYRYDSATKTWSKIATIKDGSTTTYRNSKLESSTVYKYRVKAYIKINAVNYWSDASNTIYTATKPSKVTFKTSSRTQTAIRINWKKTTCTGYQVQKYNSSKKQWETIKTITGSSTTTYRISGLKANTAYKFRVRAYKTVSSSLKVYSSWSNVKKITTKPKIPGKLTVSDSYSCTNNSITINWSKVANATGYKIYRYNGSKYVLIKDITSGSTTKYTDKNLSANTSYKYKIRPYSKNVTGTYYGTSGVKKLATKSNDTLYYISSYSYVYNTSYEASGSVSGSSYYTGCYDPHYEGYYVINYKSEKKLIKKSNASIRSNATVLQTGAIGQYGGSIAGYSACGPTAVAILVNSEKNARWSKDALILYSERNSLNDQGSLRGGGGMTAPMLLKLISGYSDGKYSAKNIYSSTSNKTSGIKSQIDSGHRVLVVTCYRSSVITSGGGRHFVVVCGYEYIGGVLYFYYADPYYGNGPRSLRRVSAYTLTTSMANVNNEPKTMIVLK